MVSWKKLADDLKMCTVIYKEIQAGRPIWFSRLAEILKDEMKPHQISLLEDRLMDLGVLDKQYQIVEEKRDGKTVRLNTYCYRICKCPEGFIENVADNVTELPKGVG